jgi:membrane protein YdbS with pleckstrin-like domain
MDNFDPRIAMMFIATGMKVLSARVLLILSMFMVFALSCAAMYDPTWIRLATVAVFGLIVFWPVCRLDRSLTKDRAIVAPED